MSKDSFIEGPISLSTRKTGYITDPETNESIEVQEKYLNHAFPYDIVQVEKTGDTQNSLAQGKIVKIIKRHQTQFVGTLSKNGSTSFVIPDNRKIYRDFYISKGADMAKDGQKVVVDFISWDDDKNNPIDKISKVLGNKGEHNVEMESIVYNSGFIIGFEKSVEDEAKRLKEKWSPIPEDEIKNRKDFRGTTTFTIDPKTAKDFDDALSLKTLDNGNYEIGIHIADVSHFVRPGTELDKEARKRAFSVYLVDRTIPMLPETLSNDLCSLNPEEDKLAFSSVFEMTPQGEVVSKWFGRTIINSDKRFTYEEAQDILDRGEGIFVEELKTLHSIATILRKEKLAKGAIRFDRDEFEFELDDHGVPIAIHKKDHIDTHWVIEEFMLLSNRNVARFIFDTDKKLNGGEIGNLMYRIHPVPDKDKISELRVFLKALGYNLEVSKKDGSISPKELNAILSQAEGKDEEGLVTTATIKTMSKAIYSVENQGHFGLAFQYYTHFTSPIRRYPDLVVHRILQNMIDNQKISDKDARDFISIAQNSTNQEIAATEAERTSIKYKQVEFMMNHIGEEFDGIISGVVKFGIFVELLDTGADGMVHVTNLGEDYFKFDEKNYRIVGEKSGEKYTLGDRVRVKIEDADLEKRTLSLKIVK